MGRIDESNGKIILGERNRGTVYEHGNSELLSRIAEEIRPWLTEWFPYHWKKMVAMSIVSANLSDTIYLINHQVGEAVLFNSDRCSLLL